MAMGRLGYNRQFDFPGAERFDTLCARAHSFAGHDSQPLQVRLQSADRFLH